MIISSLRPFILPVSERSAADDVVTKIHKFTKLKYDAIQKEVCGNH